MCRSWQNWTCIFYFFGERNWTRIWRYSFCLYFSVKLDTINFFAVPCIKKNGMCSWYACQEGPGPAQGIVRSKAINFSGVYSYILNKKVLDNKYFHNFLPLLWHDRMWLVKKKESPYVNDNSLSAMSKL